jgi:hypothetical protein
VDARRAIVVEAVISIHANEQVPSALCEQNAGGQTYKALHLMRGIKKAKPEGEFTVSIQRTLLTISELSEWMTRQLCEIEDLEGSKIIVQYSLKEPDANGCNWSDNVFLRLGPNASADLAWEHVGRLVREARKKFNVKN